MLQCIYIICIYTETFTLYIKMLHKINFKNADLFSATFNETKLLVYEYNNYNSKVR